MDPEPPTKPDTTPTLAETPQPTVQRTYTPDEQAILDAVWGPGATLDARGAELVLDQARAFGDL
jgi:hypothetical protein